MEKKLTQIPAINDWTFRGVVLVILCQIAIGVSAQTNDRPKTMPESNQVTEVKKSVAIRNPIGPASSFKPREVGDDELLEKRSEIEDSLRRGLLACSEKGAFKDLLNAPWNEQTVEQFGKLVIPDINELGPFSSQPHADQNQWACIVGLLAFVATIQRDQQVGQLAAEAFDKALAWAASKPNYYNYWHYCMGAIGRYGSSDLLTPTFWKAQDQGLNCYEAFQDLGNEKEIIKLKNEPTPDEPIAIGLRLKRANVPVPQHRYKAERTSSTGTNSVVKGK